MKHIALLATFVSLMVIAAAGGSTAWADSHPRISIDPRTAAPGDVITVTGAALGAGSTVEVRLLGADVDIILGETQADDSGGFAAQFQIPDGLTPGAYTVQATGAETASTDLTVALPLDEHGH